MGLCTDLLIFVIVQVKIDEIKDFLPGKMLMKKFFDGVEFISEEKFWNGEKMFTYSLIEHWHTGKLIYYLFAFMFCSLKILTQTLSFDQRIY